MAKKEMVERDPSKWMFEFRPDQTDTLLALLEFAEAQLTSSSGWDWVARKIALARVKELREQIEGVVG